MWLCVGNDIRQGHSYNGMLIGNHMQSALPNRDVTFPMTVHVTFEGHFSDLLTVLLCVHS